MRIILVGDTNIQNRQDPVSAFSKVKTLFDRGDILLGHAEGMFTEAARNHSLPSLPYKDRWRHSTPEMLSGFLEAGFDAVSMASNVSASPEAVTETVELATRIGMKVCGIGKNKQEARQPALITHKGLKVALIARTSVFWPQLVQSTSTKPGAATVRAYTAYQPGNRALEMPGAPPIVTTWPDKLELESLLEDIHAAKQLADCVVVSMHWGVSSSIEIQDYQRRIAHAAIEAGASLIFGHHPHLVCPLEVHRGIPIFYSLGNFAFDWEKVRGRLLDGILLEADWDINSNTLRKVKITPVRRGDDNLIAELPDGSPEAIKTRNFLLNTAELSGTAALESSGNNLVLTL